MIKAIIFDMDGVIIDSEPLWEKVFKVYFERKGIKYPTSYTFQEYINVHYRGRSQNYIIRLLKKQFKLKDSYQKIFDERTKMLFEIFDKELKAVPGTIPAIKRFHKHGYPLLLASSSPKKVINYVVNKYKIKKYFKHFVSGDNFKIGKPNPQIFLTSAKLLKKKPADILVIEDSISGVQAAAKAGMKCVVVKQPYSPYSKLKTANLIVKNLDKLNIQKIKKL